MKMRKNKIAKAMVRGFSDNGLSDTILKTIEGNVVYDLECPIAKSKSLTLVFAVGLEAKKNDLVYGPMFALKQHFNKDSLFNQ